MLNNIVNNQEQYWQQNIVQGFKLVFINIVTGWAFFLQCNKVSVITVYVLKDLQVRNV
jgi:hypothetical protein